MGQRQLAAVLFAVVGLFIILSRLPYLFFHVINLFTVEPPMYGYPSRVGRRTILAVGLIAYLLSVGIGAALVFFREKLAAWLFPLESGELVVRDAQAVAFSVLGCYFVVQGIHGSVFPGFNRWAAGIQVVLGAALFLGARGLAGLWASWRSAGTSSFSSDSQG